MAEFNSEKSSCLKEQTLIIDRDGSRKATGEYGNVSAYQNSVKVGNTPYFLKFPQFAKSSMFLKACVP